MLGIVENLSLFALIYLTPHVVSARHRWESFIIRLDILRCRRLAVRSALRIFHYSPWYTYWLRPRAAARVENLSLFALIYLAPAMGCAGGGWESFIIRLDILTGHRVIVIEALRIFHYSPWYTYTGRGAAIFEVENLSLFALIYLGEVWFLEIKRWESFIIRLDILNVAEHQRLWQLRIFHYSPWYT